MSDQSGYFEGGDGTRLFYQTMGQGPAMVACNGIGVSTFFWRYLEEYYKTRFTFITWDYPGHGRSQAAKDPTRATVEALAADLGLLVKHLGLKQVLLLGHSMGVQVIYEYYRACASNVAALIPVLGSYERPLDTFMDSARSRPIFDWLAATIQKHPALATSIVRALTNPPVAVPVSGALGLVDRLYCRDADLKQYLEHLRELDISYLICMAISMANHSAKDVLPMISCPTLIVAGERDAFTPHYLSDRMCNAIKDAEMITLKGGSHAALVEQPEIMIQRIEQFLRDHALEATQT